MRNEGEVSMTHNTEQWLTNDIAHTHGDMITRNSESVSLSQVFYVVSAVSRVKRTRRYWCGADEACNRPNDANHVDGTPSSD